MRNIRHRFHFNRFHLIWADRIVLWLAILGIAALAICWCAVAVAAGVEGANHVVLSFGLNSGPLVALIALWALLRAIDFVAGGATYRIFVPMREPEAPAVPVHEQPASTGKPMAAV